MYGHPKVLVVDDDAPSRMLLNRILTPKGYLVTECPDGEDAMHLLKNWLPDIILLDVDMPKRDGYSVLQELKGDLRTRLIPVVMLTGFDDRESRLKALSYGADDFLPKPYDDVELTVRLRALANLKRHTDELEHSTKVIETMAQVISGRDQQTGDHCGRVGRLAIRIARQLGIQGEGLRDLRLGGLLHDVGKITIPDAVLGKPGALTPEEFSLIKSHPLQGVKLVEPMTSIQGALPLIRHHHERLDGSGYPDGLKGAQIPVLVRILSVADIYDVLSSKRPYKDPWPREKCLSVLREEAQRGWWDKEVVEILAETLEKEPLEV